MLQHARHHVMPRAIKPRQSNHHQGQNGPQNKCKRTGCCIDHHPNPRNMNNLFGFDLRHIASFLRMQLPACVKAHPRPAIIGVNQPKKVDNNADQSRGAHHQQFRIATNNIRIGMMARVAPPPRIGVAHHHEARNMIDHIVHPRRSEGGAMPAFMPARIRSRSV